MPSTTDKDSVRPSLRQAGARCNPESADDTLRREALARNICGRICNAERTHDELRVIDDVLAGIEKAFPKMGGMDLASDARDFDEEAAQECRDLLVYLAMRKVAEQHKRRERIECEHADRVEAGLAELRDAEVTEPRPRTSIADFDLGGEAG